MLAHGLPIGQVLGPVDDDDQRTNLRTIDGHVGEDASRVHAVHRSRAEGGEFGRHDGRWCVMCTGEMAALG